MKNEKWTEDLYLYRMKSAPPKMEDFQEYIALYFAEKDEKYLGWFFHYYEPRLNTIIMETVQETTMQGHFADLKQSYVFGIYKALQKYDISTGVPFLIFKEFYVKNEIDAYISTMRTGYSVQSVDEYRTLRKAMALYAKYEYKFDDQTIIIIAAEIGKSVKDAKEIIRAGIDSTHYTDFYRKYADEDGESTAEEVTVDTISNPERLFLNSGRQKHCLPLTKHLITVSARWLPIISDFARNVTGFMNSVKTKTAIRSSCSAKGKPT